MHPHDWRKPHERSKPAVTRLAWLGPLAGLAALLWFLIRVIPKPARAAYLCQRAAAPLAGGFLVWAAGALGTRLLRRKLLAAGWRGSVVAAVVVAAVYLIWLPLGIAPEAGAQEAFTPAEPPNQPMGVGKGIHPGRVVWVYEPDATRWDGKTGNWWDDANTDPKVVSAMLSQALRGLTGEKTDKGAWEALFRYFNRTHGYMETGRRHAQPAINPGAARATDQNRGRGCVGHHDLRRIARHRRPDLSESQVAAGVSGGAVCGYSEGRG